MLKLLKDVQIKMMKDVERHLKDVEIKLLKVVEIMLRDRSKIVETSFKQMLLECW
jgi:hypothetical protein